MNFLDNLLNRFQKKVDTNNEAVKRNTREAEQHVGLLSALGLGGGHRRSRDEREFDRRAILGARVPDGLPYGTVLSRCR